MAPPVFDLAYVTESAARGFAERAIIYGTVAGFAFLVVWVLGKRYFASRRLQNVAIKRKQIAFEIKWSLITFAIWGTLGVFHSWLAWNGYTFIYVDAAEYGYWYLPVSFVLFIVLHDAYFYWTHRLLHHPKLFSRIHALHHRSTSPTPFAGFALHPLEALVQQGYFFLASFLVPFHYLVFFYGSLALLIGVTNLHLGHGLLPAWMGRFLSLASHHDQHHKRSRHWYGAAFTFWDRAMKTAPPEEKPAEELKKSA